MKIKNNKKKLRIFVLSVISVMLICVYGMSRNHTPSPFAPPPQYLVDLQTNIVGTFVGADDPDWTLVFTSSGKCYWYDQGVLFTVNNYSVSNTTPQCGMDVPVDENTESAYLSIVDDSDGSTEYYSIYGLSSTVLSLQRIGEGGVLLLNKQ
jgi:hypothetical protein